MLEEYCHSLGTRSNTTGTEDSAVTVDTASAACEEAQDAQLEQMHSAQDVPSMDIHHTEIDLDNPSEQKVKLLRVEILRKLLIATCTAQSQETEYAYLMPMLPCL